MKALYFDADPKRLALIKVLSLLWKQAPLSRISPLRYAEVHEPQQRVEERVFPWGSMKSRNG